MATPRDSISKENNWRMNCPATKRDVNYGECLRTVQDHKMGKHSGERECHACIHSSKCPAEFMWVEEFKQKEGLYFSPTEKAGKCPESIVNRIANIMITDNTYDRFQVDGDRRLVIGTLATQAFVETRDARPSSRQERSAAMPTRAPRRDASFEKSATSKQAKPVTPTSTPQKEGAFGITDMSEAINRMVDAEKESKSTAQKQADGVSTSKSVPATGGSLLERARALRAQKEGKSE